MNKKLDPGLHPDILQAVHIDELKEKDAAFVNEGGIFFCSFPAIAGSIVDR